MQAAEDGAWQLQPATPQAQRRRTNMAPTASPAPNGRGGPSSSCAHAHAHRPVSGCAAAGARAAQHAHGGASLRGGGDSRTTRPTGAARAAWPCRPHLLGGRGAEGVGPAPAPPPRWAGGGGSGGGAGAAAPVGGRAERRGAGHRSCGPRHCESAGGQDGSPPARQPLPSGECSVPGEAPLSSSPLLRSGRWGGGGGDRGVLPPHPSGLGSVWQGPLVFPPCRCGTQRGPVPSPGPAAAEL